ncbi:hypothetical protein A2U01_0048398, partial [Trifolium medium]|nr:hypothetical protein [Trifolium medium]
YDKVHKLTIITRKEGFVSNSNIPVIQGKM